MVPEDPDKTALGFAGLNSLASRIDVHALEHGRGGEPSSVEEVQRRAARFTHFPRSYAGVWSGLFRILLVLALMPAIGFAASLIAIAVIAFFDGNSKPAPQTPQEMRAPAAPAADCLLRRPSAIVGQQNQAGDCLIDGSNLPGIIDCPPNGLPTPHHEPCVTHPGVAPPAN